MEETGSEGPCPGPEGGPARDRLFHRVLRTVGLPQRDLPQLPSAGRPFGALASGGLPDWSITRHQGGFLRLWHNPCVKRVTLPHATGDTDTVVAELAGRHVCGPVSTVWDADG